MRLKKLDLSFYAENTHLIQALDLVGGNWESGKIRGYGVVVININSLTFGIPLRSNIKHDAAYITVRDPRPGVNGKGLDFSKAILLNKPSYVSSTIFKIPTNEHDKLKSKVPYITEKFEKYVERYALSLKNNDINILTSEEYRFSTLQNYHAELGIIP